MDVKNSLELAGANHFSPALLAARRSPTRSRPNSSSPSQNRGAGGSNKQQQEQYHHHHLQQEEDPRSPSAKILQLRGHSSNHALLYELERIYEQVEDLQSQIAQASPSSSQQNSPNPNFNNCNRNNNNNNARNSSSSSPSPASTQQQEEQAVSPASSGAHLCFLKMKLQSLEEYAAATVSELQKPTGAGSVIGAAAEDDEEEVDEHNHDEKKSKHFIPTRTAYRRSRQTRLWYLVYSNNNNNNNNNEKNNNKNQEEHQGEGFQSNFLPDTTVHFPFAAEMKCRERQKREAQERRAKIESSMFDKEGNRVWTKTEAKLIIEKSKQELEEEMDENMQGVLDSSEKFKILDGPFSTTVFDVSRRLPVLFATNYQYDNSKDSLVAEKEIEQIEKRHDQNALLRMSMFRDAKIRNGLKLAYCDHQEVDRVEGMQTHADLFYRDSPFVCDAFCVDPSFTRVPPQKNNQQEEEKEEREREDHAGAEGRKEMKEREASEKELQMKRAQKIRQAVANSIDSERYLRQFIHVLPIFWKKTRSLWQEAQDYFKNIAKTEAQESKITLFSGSLFFKTDIRFGELKSNLEPNPNIKEQNNSLDDPDAGFFEDDEKQSVSRVYDEIPDEERAACAAWRVPQFFWIVGVWKQQGKVERSAFMIRNYIWREGVGLCEPASNTLEAFRTTIAEIEKCSKAYSGASLNFSWNKRIV